MEQEVIRPSRRGFLVGLGVLAAAPAIVRAQTLMPLRGVVVPTYYHRAMAIYDIATDHVIVRLDKSRVPLLRPRHVLANLDDIRTDKLIGFFDDFIGDVTENQQRCVDFRIPHAPEDHGSPARINSYIDSMQARGLKGLRQTTLESPSE